jgi:RNA polymerase sigma-70 factor (ECF subfamily)
MAGTRDGGDPSGSSGPLTTADVLTGLFREHSGRLTAAVMRVLGDFDLAEEVVQDALLAAWQQWPVDGIPERPGGWLRTVARRRAVDVLRRDIRYRDKLARLASPPDSDDRDDRLSLIFTCCHPALSIEARVALTLRTVCGLGIAEIASAFLVDRYHLYHATRGELLRRLGRSTDARRSDRQALELTANVAERALLEQRLA